jgi:hypothetical protein
MSQGPITRAVITNKNYFLLRPTMKKMSGSGFRMTNGSKKKASHQPFSLKHFIKVSHETGSKAKAKASIL